MAVSHGLDPDRISALKRREDERFAAARPRSRELVAHGRELMPHGVPMSWMAGLWDHPPIYVAEGAGATFTDVDGHTYLDFHIADTSAFCGHAPPAVTSAVCDQAARGAQFQLPTEDALWVAAELARRWGLPRWQITLSATTANVEAIRLARDVTGREAVVMFDGKYHGHADDTLVILGESGAAPEYLGLPRDAAGRARIVQFNDVDGLATALAAGDVACVLAEPAMTNLTIVQPDPRFHAELRRLTREAGALLVLDETHTLVCGPGGLVERWRLEPDIVTIGKSIGGGVPVGAYGMTVELAARFESSATSETAVSGDFAGELATGGTLFANALSLAACRAALGDVLTDEAYARAATLGARLADGIEQVAAAAGLDWRAHRLYAKSGYWFGPTLPRNALEVRAGDDLELRALLRVALANRGIWEGGYWLGPAVSVAMDEAGVDRYLAALSEILAELAA